MKIDRVSGRPVMKKPEKKRVDGRGFEAIVQSRLRETGAVGDLRIHSDAEERPQGEHHRCLRSALDLLEEAKRQVDGGRTPAEGLLKRLEEIRAHFEKVRGKEACIKEADALIAVEKKRLKDWDR